MLSSNYLQNPKLYEGHQPNEPILLYEGAATIVQESNVIEGEATVKFTWFPAPHTKFEFIYANQTDLESGQVTLNLTEMGVITEPYPLKITSNGNRSRIEIAGFFNEPVIIGTKVKIKSLLFHLTNIPFFTAHACSQGEDDPGWDWDLDTWFGQFVYKTDRWRIVLVTMNHAPETNADQIRLLLSQLGLDSSIHHRWADLVQQSKEYNWIDGSQAITELRNAIVHPKTKERKKASRISDSAKYQAWQLGLNYLEQVLLKLFDYPWQLDWDDSE